MQTPGGTPVKIRVTVGNTTYERDQHSGPEWSRFGVGFLVNEPVDVLVEIKLAVPHQFFDTWGLTIGLARFPKGTTASAPGIDELNSSHLFLIAVGHFRQETKKSIW